MKKRNLIVFDIDDTLTKSESQHLQAYVSTMKHFGISNINKDWKNYTNVTDSFVLKQNYEANLTAKFSFDFIPEFEKKMTEILLTLPATSAIKGAGKIVSYFMQETDYAICFATGSLLEPALVKLQQAAINFVPSLVATSNTLYRREEIVTLAIAKEMDYFQVKKFNNIISVGDGIWDLKTARNLNLKFLGIGDKNYQDFKSEQIKSHILDWGNFDFQKIKTQLEII